MVAVGWVGYLMADSDLFSAEDEVRFADAVAASSPTVYDYDGNVADMEWLYNNFGSVGLTRTEWWDSKDSVYRVTEVRAQCDYATLKVCVNDENGSPLEGVEVVRYWPGAPALPDFSEFTKQWTFLGVHGPTSSDGCVGFGMGGGDYYYPPESGVSSVYVADFLGPADFFEGLGMIGETNHCHLDLTYQRIGDEFEPTPEPTDEPGDGVWEIDITIQGTIEKK